MEILDSLPNGYKSTLKAKTLHKPYWASRILWKTPSQIIEAYSTKNRPELVKPYGTQLFKYSQEMEKTLPPNTVRLPVQAVTSFLILWVAA